MKTLKFKLGMTLLLAAVAQVGSAFAFDSLYSGMQGAYRSPYSIEYSYPEQDLFGPDQQAPRNDPRLEATIPYEDWYSRRVRKDDGCWGPHPRHYPGLGNDDQIPVAWKRQRVLAVAVNHIGLPYQHHHIPAWDPPSDWPWKPVAYGHNSRGLDCSDFTSWCYNYGLGIKLDTGIVQQATTETIAGPGGNGSLQLRTITNDNGYDDLIKKLKTGDLLYIKNKQGKLAHVIMWVGSHGRSPDGTPLVIDCTGPDHTDCNGNQIPIGVQLRPFNRNSWYYNSFSHAHRILHEDEQS